MRHSRTVWTIAFLRSLLFAVIIFAADRVVDLGTSPVFLIAGSSLGVVCGTLLSISRLKHLGFIFLISIILAISGLATQTLALLSPHLGLGELGGYAIALHIRMFLLLLTLGAASTWCFFRFRATLSLEFLALSGLAVTLLAGHRQFNLQSPQIVSSLAWSMGVDSLSLLIGIALGLALFLALYLYVATLPRDQNLSRRKPNLVESITAIVLLSSLLWLIANRVYNFYQTTAATRAANGVGQSTEEGVSPLGFHSALGNSNQPAALVRLEGDYPENPFTPMLYLRESALSELSGNELVLAAKQYDRDISRTSPNESYKGEEDVELLERTPVTQSIYLLGEHKTAFALDYPISISRLKIPKERFKAAYKVYSMAPAFPPTNSLEREVGDPRWDQTTWDHYLKLHPDPRYKELAIQLTQDATTPLAKAQALVNYLSDSSIYTLSPNHEVAEGADPVAPYLFGDHRGYCVHFAHATTYLLRAVGIPARIGTGYLTDLSQAKDGHILLRMSDRHAWAEVFVRGLGWVPYDTKPKQVESHAETPVDMQTLEELMSLLEPGEEILPDDLTKDEPGVEEKPEFNIPGPSTLIWPLAGLALFFLLLKFYLRYGWQIPGSQQPYRAYRAMASQLVDLGERRLPAETREEYRNRLRANGRTDCLSIVPLLNQARYAGHTNLGRRTIESLAQSKEFFAAKPLWKRALALLNPASVLELLGGRRW